MMMTLKIGSKIKELRAKHDVTQEKFAEYLGVTPQAVSRWENGTCYPDVELFLPISNFFGITIDELFEPDRTETRKNEMYETIYRKGANGYTDEAISLARESLTEFPNDYKLMEQMADLLFYKDAVGNKDEILKFCTRIMEDSDGAKHGIIQTVALTYFRSGDDAKAKEMIEKLPSVWCTEDGMMPVVTRGDEKVFYRMKEIFAVCDLLSRAISKFADESGIEGIQKIAILNKAIDVLKIVYDDGNYGFFNHYISHRYVEMSSIHIELGDIDSALDCIEKSADHCIAFELCVGDESEFTAVLVSKVPNPPGYYHDKPSNMAYDLIHDTLLKDDVYAAVRDNARFVAVIDRLREYARDGGTRF